jgi:hypothetical protein
MSPIYGLGARTAVALTLLACLTILTATGSAAAVSKEKQEGATSTVAGWVDVPAEVAPYVVLRVVDDNTGVVVRSAPLDTTHTFSFAGIVPTAVSVETVTQLPDHLFELDVASSVLKAAVVPASSTTALQLKVVATPKTEKAVTAGAAAMGGSNVVSAVLALVALVAAWYGRHRIVSALDIPTFKPPKPRKVMVAM